MWDEAFGTPQTCTPDQQQVSLGPLLRKLVNHSGMRYKEKEIISYSYKETRKIAISETIDFLVRRGRLASLNRRLFGAFSSTLTPVIYSALRDDTRGVRAGAGCLLTEYAQVVVFTP